ncbi:guanylate-binding protein 3-like [Mya arenaria]|uniref:guanylate-binding protein 3-like n=1 Tax=Mya arenaria TaxID=6604 RepID=UPI0022E55169|nr:guanylate-binding protein 3-like [Mya arenaria]XP_052820912.1 guanylate-binding protein 3-like [Mya arenaria]
MDSNENFVDPAAASGFNAKQKLFEISSQGEQIQKNTDNARKATPLKRTGAHQSQYFTESSAGATFDEELSKQVHALPRKTSQYLSEHDSKVFQEPQCLIRAGAGNKLEICDNVLEEISCIDKPCVIVAVAGLYRTGKSFLMNLLAGKHKGFALGDTVQSMTKGIWVWCILHPDKTDTVLMLLDTEGLGDPGKGDANHDNRIFTLVTLLCGTLVYNMKGAFDQDAVNKLTFVSEMGKNIRYGGKCNEDNNLLHCVLPGFVLALRDFTLKMIIDGRKVTPDEYLDVSLQNKTRKDGSFNKPLECIRKFFPQDKRRCFAFPVPGDGDTLESIDSLKLHDLSKTFQGVAAKFVSYIFSQEPKQLQVSKPVNGYMFASLTKQYVNDLSKGAVPDVDDAFTAVAKLENERVKKECLEIFQSRMDDILLPIPATKFNKHLTEARWCALKYMRENAVEDVANAVEKYAEIEMELIGHKKQGENDEEIGKHCTNKLSSLKSLNDLKTELQNQTFEVLGGYKNFKRDVDIVKQEYEQALRDYEHREIVFPWSVVADWLGEAENRILEKDDALSEEEKQMFASLTKQYVNDLSKGAVPDVDDAFTAVAKLENERVKKECLEIFQSRMDDILLPIPATKFNKHLTEARWCALKYMRENAVEDVANAVEKYAEIEMELIGHKKQGENDEEIGKHCTNKLSSLKSLNDLKTELQNQTFEVLGGYKNFKRDVDIVKQEYEQALRDYEHREIVFPWSVVADWLGEAENRILEKDDALSEEEKQRERMEYSNSIERMKVEMAEANQTALDKQKNELEEQQKELNAERERLEKEHEHHVKMLQEKGMESESDKEHQNKARDQKKAKQKEDRASEYENTIQRLRDKIKKLKKMNKERKEKNIFSRVWNAICNI